MFNMYKKLFVILTGLIISATFSNATAQQGSKTNQTTATTTNPTAHAKDSKNDPSLPTYLVDGKQMAYEKVIKLNTSLIAAMEVYKAAEAMSKFGPQYKHGLVIVKLKKK